MLDTKAKLISTHAIFNPLQFGSISSDDDFVCLVKVSNAPDVLRKTLISLRLETCRCYQELQWNASSWFSVIRAACSPAHYSLTRRGCINEPWNGVTKLASHQGLVCLCKWVDSCNDIQCLLAANDYFWNLARWTVIYRRLIRASEDPCRCTSYEITVIDFWRIWLCWSFFQ